MEKIRHIFGYPDNLYNCSGKSLDEWEKTGEKWPRLGMLLMSIGVLYLILYIPAIYAFLKMKLTKNSCYQIMLSIIFADMINLVANSFFGGYLFSIGAVFCMDPVFMYIEGCFNDCAWSFAAFLYVVLAFNRLIVIIGSPRVTHYVMKVPIFIWLLMALSWSFYLGVLHKPMPYNSRFFLAYYIPFIEDSKTEIVLYKNVPHTFNNLIFAVLICFHYSLISLLLLFRKREDRISKKELNALLQAFFVTIPAMIGSLLYIYIQFTNKSSLGWAILGQFMWQTITGTGAIIYLTLNHSVRDFYFNHSRVQGYTETIKELNSKMEENLEGRRSLNV